MPAPVKTRIFRASVSSSTIASGMAQSSLDRREGASSACGRRRSRPVDLDDERPPVHTCEKLAGRRMVSLMFDTVPLYFSIADIFFQSGCTRNLSHAASRSAMSLKVTM